MKEAVRQSNAVNPDSVTVQIKNNKHKFTLKKLFVSKGGPDQLKEEIRDFISGYIVNSKESSVSLRYDGSFVAQVGEYENLAKMKELMSVEEDVEVSGLSSQSWAEQFAMEVVQACETTKTEKKHQSAYLKWVNSAKYYLSI